MTAAIERALRRLTLRRRRIAAVRATLVGTAAVGAWVLGAMLIDRGLNAPPAVRRVTMIAAAAFMSLTAVRVARLLWPRHIDLARTAAVAEKLDPLWQERLSTLMTQAARPIDRRGSAAMLRATADAVEAELRERPPAARVTFAAARPAGVALAVVIALWLAAMLVPAVDGPKLLARQLRPRSGLPPVTSLRVDVRPHAVDVPQGENLSITADVEGGDADAVLWTGPDTRHLAPTPMDRSYGGRFTTTLLSLQDDFVYRVTAGDATSGVTAVRVLRRPGVSRLDITLTPPGGATRTIGESDGRLRATRGTRVFVTFRVTEPVRTATVVAGERSIPATADPDGRTWRGEFVVEADARWAIELVGRRGQRGTGPAGMRVDVLREKLK